MMSAIRDALVQYVAVRRALGMKFYEPALALDHFVDFLEHEGAEFITTDLALRWAMAPKFVQRATWGRRFCHVRGFAAWLSAIQMSSQLHVMQLISRNFFV
jgi:hypothetical protein